MEIEVLTLFPELFSNFLKTSLIQKAIDRSLLKVSCTNIRDYASEPHYRVDDTPYGGGGGMLMKPEPLALAIEDAKKRLPGALVVLMTPSARTFNQTIATELSNNNQLIFICGRYEGVDQRVIDLFVDLELSIGDYVLMGGELPTMVVIEAISRLRDQVLGNKESIVHESFSDQMNIEGPQYTRPAEFRGLEVPEVLLSGDHKKIQAWRKEQRYLKTKKIRPELINPETKE